MAHRADGMNDIFEHSVVVRENLTAGSINTGSVNASSVNTASVNATSINATYNLSAGTFSYIMGAAPMFTVDNNGILQTISDYNLLLYSFRQGTDSYQDYYKSVNFYNINGASGSMETADFPGLLEIFGVAGTMGLYQFYYNNDLSNLPATPLPSLQIDPITSALAVPSGLVLPDYTTISTPAEGTLAYDFTNHVTIFYNGTIWV